MARLSSPRVLQATRSATAHHAAAHHRVDRLMDMIEYLRTQAPSTEWIVLSDGRIAAVIEGFEIVDPTISECGRFEVDPEECYGMPRGIAAMLLLHNSIVR